MIFRFNEDEEDEDHSSFSTMDHIRHFSMEDGDLSDGDVSSFGPAHLQEGIKQPLYRKSKSQVSLQNYDFFLESLVVHEHL